MRNSKVKAWLTIVVIHLCLTPFAARAFSGPCGIYDAVYVPSSKGFPQPNPKLGKGLDFALTIRKDPTGGNGQGRSIFFDFSAYPHAKADRLSTIAVVDICRTGGSPCYIIAAKEGRDEKKTGPSAGIRLEPIALDRNFNRVDPFSPNAPAPYAFVFPDTAYNVSILLNAHKLYPEAASAADISEFVKYFSPEQQFPDFRGRDTWILKDCKKHQ